MRERVLRFLDLRADEPQLLGPLALKIFLICFSYTLLRNMKDIMLLEIGKAEITSYLKSFGTLPLGVAFTLVYTWAASKFKKSTVYYVCSSIFIGLFALGMILFPFRETLQPVRGSLFEAYPPALKPIATAFENWVIVFIYLIVELYGTVIFAVLFWGFANDVVTLDQARRFYPLINLVANFAPTILGLLLSVSNDSLKSHKGIFLEISLAIGIVLGLAIMYIYRWINLHVIQPNPANNEFVEESDPNSRKKGMGFIQSLRFVFTSGYVLKIGIHSDIDLPPGTLSHF
ncbi:MAG: hypothetical protein SGCHY_001583 [Lobulomycetales sp.]